MSPYLFSASHRYPCCHLGIYYLVSAPFWSNLDIALDVSNAYLLHILCISGLLLLSVPDFGNPNLVTTSIAVEKPNAGVVTLATSVLFGEAEKNAANSREVRRTRQNELPEDDF